MQPPTWISQNKICFSQALLCPWCTAGWGREELLLKRGETEITMDKKLIGLSKKAGKPGRAGRWGGCDRQLLWTWSFWSGELWCTKVVELLILKRKIKIKATDQKSICISRLQVDDKEMMPISGHVLRVNAPWVGSVLIDSRSGLWLLIWTLELSINDLSIWPPKRKSDDILGFEFLLLNCLYQGGHMGLPDPKPW